MYKDIYELSKGFIEIYDGLEDKLDTACRKAKAEGNADIMQRLTDLADTSRFVLADLMDFSNILDEVDDYLKPEE